MFGQEVEKNGEETILYQRMSGQKVEENAAVG